MSVEQFNTIRKKNKARLKGPLVFPKGSNLLFSFNLNDPRMNAEYVSRWTELLMQAYPECNIMAVPEQILKEVKYAKVSK